MRTVNDDTRAAIASDLRRKVTYVAIAKQYGVSKSTITRVARAERLVRRKKTPAQLIRDGSLSGVSASKGFVGWLLTMPDDVVNWLVEQAPQGARASDVVRAIVIDAYHDETPATGQKTGVCE